MSADELTAEVEANDQADREAARESQYAKRRAVREARETQRPPGDQRTAAERAEDRATSSPPARSPYSSTLDDHGIDAEADPTLADQLFLKTLDLEGVSYTSPVAAAADGRAVCAGLTRGQTVDTVGGSMVTSGAYNLADASFLIAVAVSVYCPDYLPLIDP